MELEKSRYHFLSYDGEVNISRHRRPRIFTVPNILWGE